MQLLALVNDLTKHLLYYTLVINKNLFHLSSVYFVIAIFIHIL